MEDRRTSQLMFSHNSLNKWMKEKIFEQQKAFAGEKIASMSRRKVGHDYQQRQIYMITMATEGRLPLLGKVVGKSDGQKGTPEEPRVELTELGKQVEVIGMI